MSIDEKVKDLIHKDQESALVMIMDEYGMSLKRLATSILKSSMYADDIVLTAIQNLWLSIVVDKKEIKNIEAYLFKSVSNLAKILQKTSKNRIKREKIFFLQNGGDKPEILLEAVLVKKNLLTFIVNQIKNLPLTQETLVLRLAYIDELSNQEISQLLKVSEGNVKILKHRGKIELLKAIQKKIKKNGDFL